MRDGRELGATDHRLIDLATESLTLALDRKAPSGVRLQAMGRFQQLVRQLNIRDEAGAQTPSRQPARRAVVAMADPRRILSAVK